MIMIFVIIAVILYFIVKAARNTKKGTPSSTVNVGSGDTPIAPNPITHTDDSITSRLGKLGESEVSFVLHSLPLEYLAIDDVIIPDQVTDPSKRYTTQIDHIVISPFGIFVIETKNYKGWIYGSEKSKDWKETFRTTPAHYFYNPIKQNLGHVYALAEHLRLNTNLFKPIVVFSDSCRLNVETTTPVVYVSQLAEQILSYTDVIIPTENVAAIYDRLNKLILSSEEAEAKHIQSIGERFSRKENALREGRCPRCGGILKLRNGKYGAFYGCSNYPRCKFTQDIQR